MATRAARPEPLYRPPYRPEQLRRLLDPRSVALIGASAREGAFGGRVLANLAGFAGRIDLVNSRYERIGERPCHPSIDALPEVPDCAVILVPREAVQPLVEACAARGVGGAIVFASGYAETARPERIALQHRLAAIGRESGMRIVGPNCIGVANYLTGAGMTFSAVPAQAPPDRPAIGIVSQSGGLGFALALAIEHGTAVSHVLTSGNSIDVDMADYVAYLAEEPAVGAIVCLFEGMAAPGRLLAAAAMARDAGKPLIVHKIAVSESGAAAALSHTGSLAGSYAAYRAAFARAGAVLVEQFEALMETASFFAKAPPPRARGIAVAATSGGVAIMAADKAEAHRVALPQPAPATRAVLEQRIPDYGSARNPCDVTAQVITDPESLNACAGALLADPAYAALLVPSVYAYAPAVRRVALLDALAAQHGKMICNVWVNEHLEGPGTREAEVALHSALFRSLDRCFATLAAWQQRAETMAAVAPPAASPVSPLVRDQVATALRAAAGGSIGEHAAKALLALYGLPVVGEHLVTSADAAVAAAAAIGGPVALKVESPDLPHKSDAGVIRLDLSGEAAVRAGHAAILDKARHAGARVAGVLVQPMIAGGVEMLLGVRVDPLFGPLVVVGLGGVLTEVLRDTATELAPLGPAQARAMLERLRGAALLRGFRGGPVVDLDALAETICRLGAFAADHAGLLREIDINPLICTGERLLAVDALIVTAENDAIIDG